MSRKKCWEHGWIEKKLRDRLDIQPNVGGMSAHFPLFIIHL